MPRFDVVLFVVIFFVTVTQRDRCSENRQDGRLQDASYYIINIKTKGNEGQRLLLDGSATDDKYKTLVLSSWRVFFLLGRKEMGCRGV